MNQRLKRILRNFTEDGIPVDAKTWTEADWQDLWNAMEQAKRSIAERHKDDAANEFQRNKGGADAV